jgi:hypothetical protein
MDTATSVVKELRRGVQRELVKREKYAAVMFEQGGMCILPLVGGVGEEYRHMLDLELQAMVGDVSSVFEYDWKGFRTDFTRRTGGQMSMVYIDNMCGKVKLTGVVCPLRLKVAKLVNPSFHFGIKYKFFTVHGQYMMQSTQKGLTFKGCKDVKFVNRFIEKLTGEMGMPSQRPTLDMISVTCGFNRPLSISMNSLFDVMLRTVFRGAIWMNPRSDEDTQQMHFKVVEWTPFLELIHHGNYFEDDAVASTWKGAGAGAKAGFDAEELVLSSVTSIGVNANGVFKIRFTWANPITCSEQAQINQFARLANALCMVLLSKVGVIYFKYLHTSLETHRVV